MRQYKRKSIKVTTALQMCAADDYGLPLTNRNCW